MPGPNTKGNFRVKCHDHCGKHGTDNDRSEECSFVHASHAEYVGHECQHICHREEGCYPCKNFGAYIVLLGVKTKEGGEEIFIIRINVCA